MRDCKSKQNMMASEPWFKNTKLNKTRLHQLKTKSIRGCLSSPPERSVGAHPHTNQFFNTNQCFEEQSNYSELPPIVDRQEEKNNFLLIQG